MAKNNQQEANRRQLLTASSAALFYGGWAYYVNRGSNVGLYSSAIQFLLSFVAGYMISGVIEYSFFRLRKPIRFWFCAFVPYLVFIALLVGSHTIIGTAHPIKTVALNAIVGTLYFVIYTRRLERQITEM